MRRPLLSLGDCRCSLRDALNHHMFDLRDRFRWVQPFRTNLRTVHDRVAAIELEWILEIVKALSGRFITAID